MASKTIITDKQSSSSKLFTNKQTSEKKSRKEKVRKSTSRSSNSTQSLSPSEQEEKDPNSFHEHQHHQPDLKEFRAKTIDRIINKRREFDAKYLQYHDEKRKESNAFRTHWKENLRRQRLEAVINEVDKKIVRSSIPTNALPLNQYSDGHLGNVLKLRRANERQLDLLTADLADIDDIIPSEKRKDSGVYTLSLKRFEGNKNIKSINSGKFSSSNNNNENNDNNNNNNNNNNNSTQPVSGGRIRSASIEFNSGKRYSLGASFLQYICAFDLNIRNKIAEPWSSVPPKLRFEISSERDTKKMNNQLQIIELLDDILVKDDNTASAQKDGHIRKGSNIIGNQRLPKGYMLEVFQEILETRFPANGTRISHSISIDDYSAGFGKSALFLSAVKDPKNENPTISSLVDGCFLIGPDHAGIINLMNERSHANLTTDGPNTTRKDKLPSMQTKHIIVPKVLFRSEFHFPPEMLQLLPSYCFPSNAEVTLDTSLARVKSLSRKDSVRVETMANQELAKKTGINKRRMFFPSDETIKIEDDISPIKDNTPPPTITSTMTGIVPAHSTMSSIFKAPFIILLGDHTYQQYCLGFYIPVVFFDAEKGYTVHTTYCLCFLTKFAFFSFLIHLIQQIDEELKIFAFKEALPEYDPNFPLNLNLRVLNELTNKLKKIMVPLYPYLIRNETLLPISASQAEDVNAGNQKVSHTNTNTEENPNNGLPVSSNYPANSEYLAVLQDLQFSLSVNKGPLNAISSSVPAEKKQFNFPRTFYQKYYSHYLSNLDVSLDPSSIHYYEKQYEKQGKSENVNNIIGRNHASEKDREDSFFILQWALPTLLKYLPLDQIILALGCAMTEMKLLVKHKDLNVVSSVILALTQLLKPLKWCSPVIITLPDELIDLIESPVPIILGLQKLPPGFALPERYVVIDPGERIVHLNPFDLVQSQSILLPNGSRLVSTLKSCSEAILKYHARAKRARFKQVTISPIQSDKISPTPTLSPFASTVYSPIRPVDPTDFSHVPNPVDITPPPKGIKRDSSAYELGGKISCPLELDYQNPDCINFLGFIKQFVVTVHNHILAILNTAIHMQHVEKQKAKAERRVVAKTTLETQSVRIADPHRTVNTERGSQFPKRKIPVVHTESLDVGVGSYDKDEPSKKKPPKGSPQRMKPSAVPANPTAQRDSDELSEVTLTDFPVMEDNDPMSNMSFSSSSSSLPSLASDAPLLAAKDIGQNGLKFVQQLIDTQMYSNYCQSLKLHSSTTTVDGSVMGAFTGERRTPGPNKVLPATSVVKNDYRSEISFDDPSFLFEDESFDSITGLFEIILSGSVALEGKTGKVLKQIYDKLYPTSQKVSIDLTHYEREWFTKISRLLKSRSKLQRYIKKLIKSIALTELRSHTYFDDLQDTLKQCNGLICNGFCNTAICSAICIDLWAAKVKKLRHHQVAYEIVSKKYEKRKPLTNNNHPGGDDFNTSKRLTLESNGTTLTEGTEKSSPKIQYITKGGPRYEAFRHPSETESQYRQRKLLTQESILRKASEIPNKIELPSPRVARISKEKKKKKRKEKKKLHAQKASKMCTAVSFFKTPSILHMPSSPIKSPQSVPQLKDQERKTYLKRRKFIADDTSCMSVTSVPNKYLYSLAKYYAKKEEKLVKKYRRRCIRRIQGVLIRWIYTFRRVRSLKRIQSLARGFLVRKHFSDIMHVYFLEKEERIRRFISTLMIRNYLRRHAEEIYRAYAKRKQLEYRKRLNTISIPIAPPISASDSIRSARSKSSSPVPFGSSQTSMKYISDPTLPIAPPVPETMPKSPKREDTSGTPRNSKKELSIDAIDDGEAAFAAGNTKKSGHSYADRAREFLQFGKILSRSSLSTPRLPMRRRSSDMKKTAGVAIPSNDDPSNPLSTMEHANSNREDNYHGFLDDTTDNQLTPEKADASIDVAQDPAMSPTERAIFSGGGNFLATGSGLSGPPPLPPRFSIDQAISPKESGESPARIASRSRSHSGDIDRANSQDNNSLQDEVVSHSSSFPRMTFFSLSNEPELANENESQSHSRGSFISRGLTSFLRSKSTESNQSAKNKHRNTTPSVGVSTGYSPIPIGNSRDSLDIPENNSGTNTNPGSVTGEEREKEKEKEKPKRFSRMFERSSTDHGSLTFPGLFGFGNGEKVRRGSRGSMTSLDGAEDLGKVSAEADAKAARSRVRSEDITKSRSLLEQSISNNNNKSSSSSDHQKPKPDQMLPIVTIPSNGPNPPTDEKNDFEGNRNSREDVEDGGEGSESDDDDDDENVRHLSDDLSTEFENYPLKSLGSSAMEYINRQQVTSIKKMWQLLLNGLPFIKHGRSGKPKGKLLFCDYAMTRLYWRAPGSKPDPSFSFDPSLHSTTMEGSGGGGDSLHDTEERSGGGRNSDVDSLTHGGSEGIAADHQHTPKKSKSKSIFPFRRSSFTKSDKEREIPFKDILSVTSDGKSEVFQRSLTKHYFQQPEDTSLITLFIATRTLDIEMESNFWQDIYPALQIIVNYYQVNLPAHQSIRPELREQLTYIFKNGIVDYSNLQETGDEEGMGEGGGEDVEEEEEEDVVGYSNRNVGKKVSSTTAPPNTPMDHPFIHHHSFPKTEYPTDQRSSLSTLFPIAENQLEDDK